MGHDTDTKHIRSRRPDNSTMMLMMDCEIRIRPSMNCVHLWSLLCLIITQTKTSSRNHYVYLTKTAQVHFAHQKNIFYFILHFMIL